MRLLACIKKDILLLTGGGIRSAVFLLFPVLLVFGMLFFMKDAASAGSVIKSFDIAIRDLDETIMSRTLINQIGNVELFDNIVRAEDEDDTVYTESGCAAVVTIPKDFFYDLYSMKDTDVILSLNDGMPVEAALVRETFVSLLNILSENQRAAYAAARVRYGELSSTDWDEVYSEYSEAVITDALSRLGLYELDSMYKKSYDGTKLFFIAGIFSMLLMYIPLNLLRSVSEELEAGLAERFSLAGGSIIETVISKLLTAFIMVFVPASLIIIIFGVDFNVLPVLLVLFISSFAFFLLLSLVVKNASVSQLLGCVIMLSVLLFGGALYPASLLPEFIKPFSGLLMPDLILTSLKYAYVGRGISFGIKTLVHAVLGLGFILLSIPLLKLRKRA